MCSECACIQHMTHAYDDGSTLPQQVLRRRAAPLALWPALGIGMYASSPRLASPHLTCRWGRARRCTHLCPWKAAHGCAAVDPLVGGIGCRQPSRVFAAWCGPHTAVPPERVSPGCQLWLGRALARSGDLQVLDRVMRAVTQAPSTSGMRSRVFKLVYPVICRWAQAHGPAWGRAGWPGRPCIQCNAIATYQAMPCNAMRCNATAGCQ